MEYLQLLISLILTVYGINGIKVPPPPPPPRFLSKREISQAVASNSEITKIQESLTAEPIVPTIISPTDRQAALDLASQIQDDKEWYSIASLPDSVSITIYVASVIAFILTLFACYRVFCVKQARIDI